MSGRRPAMVQHYRFQVVPIGFANRAIGFANRGSTRLVVTVGKKDITVSYVGYLARPILCAFLKATVDNCVVTVISERLFTGRF